MTYDDLMNKLHEQNNYLIENMPWLTKDRRLMLFDALMAEYNGRQSEIVETIADFVGKLHLTSRLSLNMAIVYYYIEIGRKTSVNVEDIRQAYFDLKKTPPPKESISHDLRELASVKKNGARVIFRAGEARLTDNGRNFISGMLEAMSICDETPDDENATVISHDFSGNG